MANDFPGPLSPEQLAAVQGYYGVPGVNVSEPAAPAAAPPLVDAGAYYNYAPPPDEPAFGPPPAPPAPARPVGAQLSQLGDPQGGRGASLLTPPRLPEVDVDESDPRAALNPALPVTDLGELDGPRVTATVGGGGGGAPSDDREFEAYKKLISTRKPAGGGGGGGPANPDPFGVKGAQQKFLGTFDEERDALRAGAVAEGDRASTVAGMRADLARQQQEDAAVHAHEVELAQSGFDAHMGEVQRQLDAVREQKVDPGRLMRGDGMAMMGVVGGLLGGLYMGLNKLDHNPFLDDLNRQIDRDIAVQEKNIDGARRDVGDRMNLLREQRATFKDNELAKLQSKQLMYEATKQSIEARAADYDQPIVQARVGQAVSIIDRAQAQTDMEIKAAAQRHAQAMAAAGAAQMKAQQLEMRKAFADTYADNVKAGMSPAQAEAEAGRMVQNLFQGGANERPAATAAGSGGDPLANVPKTERSEAAKELREHADRENAKKAIDKAFATYAASDVTDRSKRDALKAQVRALIKPHMKGANSDVDMDMLINPLVPDGGLTTQAAQNSKRDAAKAILDAEGTTPLLDRHSPGWKGAAPVQLYDSKGKPKS